jgi:murein DD-endopeptidase MepM/ murein hydrolase activator NlpD
MGTPLLDARERRLRLIGACLVVVFTAGVAVAWASPVAARDWTPQIKTARTAQVYWESVMRAAVEVEPSPGPDILHLPFLGNGTEGSAPAADHALAERGTASLEKQLKQQKRELKKAKRKARRAARNARSVSNRLAATQRGWSDARARRESAERSLGSWILTMERYARIRAAKKSKARPGVTSSFAWPARGRISQYYTRSHDGLDIASYRGAPIRASAFGVVSYVGWNPWDQHGRAFMVVVTHATGFETLYGHVLPRRSVRVGQEVRKGEVIGYMGSTGYSSGTHLHFELRRGRTTINPLGYL